MNRSVHRADTMPQPLVAPFSRHTARTLVAAGADRTPWRQRPQIGALKKRETKKTHRVLVDREGVGAGDEIEGQEVVLVEQGPRDHRQRGLRRQRTVRPQHHL